MQVTAVSLNNCKLLAKYDHYIRKLWETHAQSIFYIQNVLRKFNNNAIFFSNIIIFSALNLQIPIKEFAAQTF